MSVGLMPLADSDWCNGKCSYKMLCYMATGLPVVVTPAGMNCEVLALGDAGFGATTEQEWVDALIALIDDAGLRQRMGSAGKAVIDTHFSLDQLTRRYAAIFQSLLPDALPVASLPGKIVSQLRKCRLAR
jgi:glycosyltransferase involved in cell wall biosynthesis